MMETQKTHQEDVLHKVLMDFQMAKIEISEYRVEKELAKCWEMAQKMIMKDKEP